MKKLLIILMILLINLLFSKAQNKEIVKDIDGNEYHTIKIGNQIWMSENLKTTKYRNGESIPNVSDYKQWSKLTEGAYCFYGNDENNANIYGNLYNWHAIMDSRNIAPQGWHVPTDAEWRTLNKHIRGKGNMKKLGIQYWYHEAKKESGFSALPGGFRVSDGEFAGKNFGASWWTSSSKNIILSKKNLFKAWRRYLTYNKKRLSWRTTDDMVMGNSVRCVKD